LQTRLLTSCRSIGRCAVGRFYQEPEERVYEVVRQVLAERDLPEHDPERMIEGWAREHGAGVYGEKRQRSGLEGVMNLLRSGLLMRKTRDRQGIELTQ
jgi:hypothetical protein